MKKKSTREKKWRTLQHNGILFPPVYEAKGLSIYVNSKKVNLTPFQEEMAYLWAKKKDTPYVQDKVFQKNFTKDFSRQLGKSFSSIKYHDIDFSELNKLVDEEKDAKERMTKEGRKALAKERKELREKLKKQYGIAILDGEEVEVANYMAEPPGIFIGRGAHPLRGRWKKRITYEDITLNLGKDANVPFGKWGKIVHNQKATWLACWVDELTQNTKYVWFADTVGIKQKNDKAKYVKAENLAKSIERISEKIRHDMKGGDVKKKIISTACYLIYRTAMRVGDEKDPDEADTVGATTLRKEHVKIMPDAIKFDFLGKDSVRWRETIKVEGRDKQFHTNLKELTDKISLKDEIFGDITSRHVNAYFSSIVDGLSAKVFRTYLASTVVTKYLKKIDDISKKTPIEKIYYAKLANLEAAKMCNHKRTIPKTFEKSLEKKRETLEKAKNAKTKTKKQKIRKKERINKLEMQLELAQKTRDYNLGTSLRNYIDPRVLKSWTDHVDAPWEKLYTSALQRKFLWVKDEHSKWSLVSKKY
ncbi:MAG: DNA topoisomerase I B [Cenarchaeum symbiont of Oopsacas minuta]|nr:DNA topoisomerase I B [Cenarchaeum symbiont of Oopsacas minuta]